MLLWLFWHVTYRTSGQFSSLLSDMLLIQNIFTRHPEVESQVCQFPFHVSSLENWKLQLMSTGDLITQCPNLTHWNKITTKMQKMMPGLYETKLLTKDPNNNKKVISNSEVRPGGISALKPLMEYRSTITSRPSLAKSLHYYADISLNLPRSPKQKKQFLVSLHCVIFSFLNSLSSKSAVFCETYMSDEKFSTKVSYSDLLGHHSKISNAVETATKEKCVLYYYRW